MKLLKLTWSVTAVLLCAGAVYAEGEHQEIMEQSTVSPVANVSAEGDVMKVPAAAASSTEKTEKDEVKQTFADSQTHTIADFIIHPLIALKPRLPATEKGKQAAAASSSTPSSPWQLFNFSPGQGLGSSVSSLAGWLGNRIQFPALVDTPVRESANSGITPTSARPDIVVKIQQRPSNQKPSSNKNNRPNRKSKRPNRFNVNYGDYSQENDYINEYDDEGDFNRKPVYRRRYQIYEDDDYDNEDHNIDEAEEDDDDEEEEDEAPVKSPKNRIKLTSNNSNSERRRPSSQQQRKQQLQQEEEEKESNEKDQYDEDENDDDHDFKRSENELNFIQSGHQNLMKQLKQFNRGQTPTEVANSLRKSPTANKNKRRQQTILLINHRGQTFYLPAELLQVTEPASSIKRYTTRYPQSAYKRKPQPNQYITIPWSQLGVLPQQQIVSQRLILQTPPKSKDNKQTPAASKKKPSITANAVPLVAEAALMDVFRPSRIQPTRSPTTSKSTTVKPSAVVAAVKPAKTATTLVGPANMLEMAPAVENSAESLEDDDSNSAQYIVIGDQSVAKKFTRSNYRQILNYFKQNRVGRQLNDGSASNSASVVRNEQFIPVQIVAGEEEPFENLNAVNDKLQTNAKADILTDDSRKEIDEVVKTEKPETNI